MVSKTLHNYPFSGLLFAIILWSLSMVAMKITIEQLGPILTVLLRLIIASVFLLPFLPRLLKQGVRRQDWKWLLLMALFEPCLYFVMEGFAVKYTTASEAGMITSVQPLLIALGAWIFLKEKTTTELFIGSLIAFLGVLIMSMNGETSASAPNPTLGNGLELIAMFVAAGYAMMSRKMSQHYSPLFLTALQAFAGTLFFIPLALIFPTAGAIHINLLGVVCLVFLGLGVNVVAFLLYNNGLKLIGANKLSVWLNLVPLGTFIFGWLLLDEQLQATQYAGAFVVLIGLGVSQWRTKKAFAILDTTACEEKLNTETI